MKRYILSKSTLTWSLLALAGACDDDGALSMHAQNVTAVCVPRGQAAPAGSWQCSTPLTLQCGAAAPAIYVSDPNDPSCAAPTLMAADVDTTRLGPQSVVVRGASGGVACEATVNVVDATAPVLAPRTINLWPPNHKYRTVTVEDCVGAYDVCDPSVTAEFIWASSDEPIDDKGDGHHAPDILFDGCDRVQVRAERQGPKDGRVYKLGVRAVDGAGHEALGECAIIVDHDQRGVPAQGSGESYRIPLDGTNGRPACDGLPTVPPAHDAATPTPDAGTVVVGI